MPGNTQHNDVPDADVALYFIPGSVEGRIVRMLLEEKSVSYKSHRVNILAAEDLKPVYEDYFLQDREVVLLHNGNVLHSFDDAFDYINRAFPEPQLLPSDPDEKKNFDLWMRNTKKLPLLELTYQNPNMLRRVGLVRSFEYRIDRIKKAQKKHPEHIDLYEAKIGNSKRIISLLESHHENISQNTLLHEIFSGLDEAMIHRDYVCSQDRPYAVDYAWAGILYHLKVSGYAAMWQGGKFPRVSTFLNRMGKRKSFKAVCVTSNEMAESATFMAKGAMSIMMQKMKDVGKQAMEKMKDKDNEHKNDEK